MLQKLKEHIESNLPFLKDKRLLIAISGGVDSVVLTYLLKKLDFQIALAHCNFQLRGQESDLDEALILSIGKELAIPVFSTKFETQDHATKHKKSIQVAARELRYNYFDEILNEQEYDFILTAHHADDNLETFLINLTRGTGLDGLTGIPTQNGKITRPLLVFSRLEILNYANSNAITWREDQSNSENKYIRNKIRNEVVPILKEINPSLLESFQNTNKHLQESQEIVKDCIENVRHEIITKDGDITKFNIEKILGLSNPKAYLYHFLKDYGFKEWNNVFNLLHAQTGKYLETNSHLLLRNREFLLFSRKLSSATDAEKFYEIPNNQTTELNIPFKIYIENTTKTKVVDENTILVDKNLLIYPLFIRKKKQGDFFYPTGMLGKKKLSKFFKDEKMSMIEKDNTWLLCDANNQIVWVIGKRQDRRFKVNTTTKNNIRISINPKC